MNQPRHISEILPGVIDRIAQANGHGTGKTPETVREGSLQREAQTRATSSTGDPRVSTGSPAGTSNLAGQPLVGTAPDLTEISREATHD